jgi:hypothetical protein
MSNKKPPLSTGRVKKKVWGGHIMGKSVSPPRARLVYPV